VCVQRTAFSSHVSRSRASTSALRRASLSWRRFSLCVFGTSKASKLSHVSRARASTSVFRRASLSWRRLSQFTCLAQALSVYLLGAGSLSLLAWRRLSQFTCLAQALSVYLLGAGSLSLLALLVQKYKCYHLASLSRRWRLAHISEAAVHPKTEKSVR
jgi:hypothetical protein